MFILFFSGDLVSKGAIRKSLGCLVCVLQQHLPTTRADLQCVCLTTRPVSSRTERRPIPARLTLAPRFHLPPRPGNSPVPRSTLLRTRITTTPRLCCCTPARRLPLRRLVGLVRRLVHDSPRKNETANQPLAISPTPTPLRHIRMSSLNH